MVGGILIRKLRRDLWHRKGSVSALLMVVVIGVGVFVGMGSVFHDLDRSRARYYRDYRLADFTVDVKRAPAWAIDRLSELPNVERAHGRVSLAVLIDLPGRERPLTGLAISMPKNRTLPVMNGLLLRRGTWFSPADRRSVILNEAFAKANGLYPGSRIKVTLLDRQHELLVTGWAMSPEFVYVLPLDGGFVPDPERSGVIYLSERFLRESCDLRGAYNQVLGRLRDNSPRAVDNTLRLMEARLDAFGVLNSTPRRNQPSVQFMRDELQGLKVTATVIPAIFLGVAAMVLNILLGRLVTQQRTVVGTLKALGYSRRQVLVHYLTLGLVIGVVGGAVGVGFGCWMQAAMLPMYQQFYALPGIRAHFYPGIALTGVTISVICATLGTLKAARAATALAPAVAMRPAPPERGGKVFVERFSVIGRNASFITRMIVRAVFRNPFRSAVSILASAISTALVLTTLSLVDSMNYLMHYQFEALTHEDLSVSLRDPRGRGAVAEVGGLPGVNATEPQLGMVCDLSNGTRSRRIAVTGLPRHNRLSTPLDREGRPIVLPEEGLVLTRKLAEMLGIRPGEAVRLRPLLGRRRIVTAPVLATVETFLGLAAYARMDYLSRLLGEVQVANAVLATTYPGSDERRLLGDLKQRPGVVGIGERTRSLSHLEDSFGQTMGAMIWVMVFFAGLIAFGSVFNAAMVSLGERQREVGTLRVLGYAPATVWRIFSGESFGLNGAGVLVGLAVGVGLSHLLSLAYDTELYRFPVVLTLHRFIQTTLVMAGFIGLSQLVVYRLIRKLDWLEVLKVKE